MTEDLARLEAILRRRVCGACDDRDAPEDLCGRPDPDVCSLNALMPEVARAVLATESNDIADYIRAIREHVCSLCGHLRIDGKCDPRELPVCALEARMNRVIDAIEEATGRIFERHPQSAFQPAR